MDLLTQGLLQDMQLQQPPFEPQLLQ